MAAEEHNCLSSAASLPTALLHASALPGSADANDAILKGLSDDGLTVMVPRLPLPLLYYPGLV